MITPEALEAFHRKWRRPINSALKEINHSIERAGYAVSSIEEDPSGVEHDPPLLRWFMYTDLPTRPQEDADSVIMVTFDIVANEPEDNLLTPMLEADVRWRHDGRSTLVSRPTHR